MCVMCGDPYKAGSYTEALLRVVLYTYLQPGLYIAARLSLRVTAVALINIIVMYCT